VIHHVNIDRKIKWSSKGTYASNVNYIIFYTIRQREYTPFELLGHCTVGRLRRNKESPQQIYSLF